MPLSYFERKAAGLCAWCPQPATVGVLCEPHADWNRLQNRGRRIGKGSPNPRRTKRVHVRECGIVRADGLCVYCQRRLASSADHALPVSRGGTDDAFNLVACCGPCQQAKGNKTAEEFIRFFPKSAAA